MRRPGGLITLAYYHSKVGQLIRLKDDGECSVVTGCDGVDKWRYIL